MSQRYQRGSIRRQNRINGQHVWVWRHRVKGIMKQESYPVEGFPTEKALWMHLAPAIALLNQGSSKPMRVVVKMGMVIER